MSGTLRAARQAALNSVVALEMTPSSDQYDRLCQLACARTWSGILLRKKLADAEVAAAGAVGTDNAVDFSAAVPHWGAPRSWANSRTFRMTAQASTNVRLYRGGLIDMERVTATPVAITDADWTRVLAPKTASGGTVFA